MPDQIEHKDISMQGSRISWNPDVDPVTEERLSLFAKNDLENWKRLMSIVFMNRRKPVTFLKKKIKWT